MVKEGNRIEKNAIEVGHLFYFGDKYSLPLDASVINKEGKKTFVKMGSYGIGISRLAAAIIEVFHDDREIEFIQLKRELESLYSSNVIQADHKSCEMMVEDLYIYIKDHYPGRDCIISVSEDGENGSQIDFLGETL